MEERFEHRCVGSSLWTLACDNCFRRTQQMEIYDNVDDQKTKKLANWALHLARLLRWFVISNRLRCVQWKHMPCSSGQLNADLSEANAASCETAVPVVFCNGLPLDLWYHSSKMRRILFRLNKVGTLAIVKLTCLFRICDFCRHYQLKICADSSENSEDCNGKKKSKATSER
jgi:hypothetical protein